METVRLFIAGDLFGWILVRCWFHDYHVWGGNSKMAVCFGNF